MRDPDFTGAAARAWRIKKPDAGPLAWQASIVMHLINAPGIHAFWSWWSIGVVHLRDIPGVEPAFKQYPTAEYELLVMSLNPEHGAPDPDNPEGGYSFLDPPDVVLQFHGINDGDAERICELAVQAVCDGILSPDQDGRAAWERMIPATVDHFARGMHRQ